MLKLTPKPAPSTAANSAKLLADAVRTMIAKKAAARTAEESAKAATGEVELLSGLVAGLPKTDCKPVEVRGIATLSRTYIAPVMGLDQQKLIEVLSKVLDGERALKIVEMCQSEVKKGYSFLAVKVEK